MTKVISIVHSGVIYMNKNITPIERHKKNVNATIVISTIVIVLFVSIITYMLNMV